MSRVDRRVFLKSAALASAAAAGVITRPAVAAAHSSDPSPARRGPRQWRRTPCRMCGVGCGLLVAIEDGRVVAVKGDPDSPVAKGLACAKGYYAPEALRGNDRLTTALVRRDGALVPAPMREALDLVARRIGDTIGRHGVHAVAMYGSGQWPVTDAYIAAKFMKGALGTNDLDTSDRMRSGSARAGLEGSFGVREGLGSHDDIDHADLFVLWNVNLAESDPVLFSRMLERRRTDPSVRIVELATRTSRTSYAANASLLLRPHTELAVANAICQEIVARGQVDRPFVERYTTCKRGAEEIGHALATPGSKLADATGASWKDFVDFVGAYTPERAQQISGIPAESIRWLASLYADRTRKALSVWGTAVNGQVRGTWTNNALHNIHLLVGKVATPGHGAVSLSSHPSGGAPHAAGAAPDTLPGGNVQEAAVRQRTARSWGIPESRLDATPGRSALAIFQAFDRGDVRTLWIQGANPLASLAAADGLRRTSRGDRFVVVSDVYPTATTAIADVVLPAAMWLEREGVFASSERRLQHFPRLLTPPGEAMSDGWQVVEVARRLGHAALFPWSAEGHVGMAWDEYRALLDPRAEGLPSLDELRTRGGSVWPRIAAREVQWRDNTALDPSADAARGAFDVRGHDDHRAWIWLRPHEPPAESPDRAYPFWLTTGEVLEHWGTGTLTRRVALLRGAIPRAYVELHRDDARQLGVRDGDVVRLTSRRASIELTARVDFRGQPPRGVVFVPDFDESAGVNRLLLDACCPISGQPERACAVQLQRVAGEPKP